MCRWHGGAAPQVIAAAQVRIMQAAYLRGLERAAVRTLKRRARLAKKAAMVLGIPEDQVDSRAISDVLIIEAWEAAAREFESGGDDA